MLKSFVKFCWIGQYCKLVFWVLFLYFVVVCFCFYLFHWIFFLLPWIRFLHCSYLSIFLFWISFCLICDTSRAWSWILMVFDLNDFISSFMHFLIGSVSYALSAITYWILYFFKLRIEAIANLYRVWVLLLLVNKGSFVNRHQLQYGICSSILRYNLLFLSNICLHNHC